MESRFFKHRSVNATAESRPQSFPDLAPQPPTSAANFATGLRNMLGEDAQPDALFFVESWTLSVPQAIENLRLRQSERQPQSSASNTPHPDQAGSAAFVQQAQWRTQPARQPIPQTCVTAMSGFAPMETPLPQAHAAQPAHAAREDRSEAGNPEVIQKGEIAAQRAWTLLGVAANSTRAQIRSAYRRMVSRWHPDRHEHIDEESRQFANEKMSAINEAYRLLRDSSMLETIEGS